jgi:acyl-coenzyme A thioesterase PaaI-like protein
MEIRPMTNGDLNPQPISKHCFVCGIENRFGLQMRFYEYGEGKVYADYAVPEQYQGYPGHVHGGILATMLDELMGRALMSGDPNHFSVTAKIAVRFRKPVPIDQPIKLMGMVLQRRGRISLSRAEIRLPDGSVAVEAEATLVDLPRTEVEEAQLESLGWKVYPDSTRDIKAGVGDEQA